MASYKHVRQDANLYILQHIVPHSSELFIHSLSGKNNEVHTSSLNVATALVGSDLSKSALKCYFVVLGLRVYIYIYCEMICMSSDT